MIGGIYINIVKLKKDLKTIERHPVKVLGKDYRVKIIYKNVKVAELNVEEDTIKIILQNKFKKVSNEQMLDFAIQKMYNEIAKVEIERSMEKMRIMLGFAPEDYMIKRINSLGKCEDKNIIVNPDIVMYGREVIDYVVLKQYCHLKYKTNCKKYFELLEKYCKNYKKFEKLGL
ncbi:MAG: DUF45 domain-containing protein [Clostridia bacterium]|nr:DUF45 domain-containing protein [Clostridia bacterium]